MQRCGDARRLGDEGHPEESIALVGADEALEERPHRPGRRAGAGGTVDDARAGDLLCGHGDLPRFIRTCFG
jgi:hypothetical protein